MLTLFYYTLSHFKLGETAQQRISPCKIYTHMHISAFHYILGRAIKRKIHEHILESYRLPCHHFKIRFFLIYKLHASLKLSNEY